DVEPHDKQRHEYSSRCNGVYELQLEWSRWQGIYREWRVSAHHDGSEWLSGYVDVEPHDKQRHEYSSRCNGVYELHLECRRWQHLYREWRVSAHHDGSEWLSGYVDVEPHDKQRHEYSSRCNGVYELHLERAEERRVGREWRDRGRHARSEELNGERDQE